MHLVLATVAVAQLLDLGTFIRMVWLNGPSAEANPIVAGLLLGYGLPFVAVAKVAGLSLVNAVIVVLAGRSRPDAHPQLVHLVAGLAVVAGLIGGWSNALVLLGRPA
jgi:hypothetical protein